MAKKTLMLVVALIAINLLLVPVFSLSAQNLGNPADFGLGEAGKIGLPQKDLPDAVVAIVKLFLGFLGLMAVVVILIGGFQWLLAAGNTEKIEKAQQLLWGGVIGLAIVIGAFTITNFVITRLQAVLK